MREIGIYVHIPFCLKKCKYCDFISFDNCGEGQIDEYVNLLEKSVDNSEVFLNLSNLKIEDIVVDTIYFGGGTPSSIDSKYIVQILNKIREKFKIKEDAEITLEVNPGTASKAKFEKYINSGFNRISIGLQSTNNMILQTIGRIHSFEQFLETIKMAKDVRFQKYKC